MAELVTIYCTLPNDVAKTVQLLQNHNLHPVVVDDPDKMGVYRSHEVRIAVPQTESDMAAAILAEAERKNAARLSEVTKATNGIVLIMIAALGFVAMIGIFDTRGAWFLGVWIVLIVVAAAALIRWAWRKK